MGTRRIKLTEEQMNYILKNQGVIDETTGCCTVGDIAYDAPAFIDKATADRKPGFSCKRLKQL